MKKRKKIARRELESLQSFLRGKVDYDNGVQSLKIDPSIGEGQVHCLCFADGLTAMEFDIKLNESRAIYLNVNNRNSTYFLYCLQGNCFHQFNGNEVIAKLEELQTAVVSNNRTLQSKLLIQKNERLILNVICIDKERYLQEDKGRNETFYSKTISLLNLFQTNQGSFHLGKINLEIGELIKMLENAKYADDLSTLMEFEGICHLILAKQIMQFKFEMEGGEHLTTTLLKRELQQITEVSNYITAHPDIQHTISKLCVRTGLSAVKLQKGFRFLYNMTVGDFIRESRLKRAVILLKTSELNVSEVVYSIGFTSRSYFCKIFKAKYGCSPKQYKQSQVKSRGQIKT